MIFRIDVSSRTLFEQFSLYYQLNKGKEPWNINNQKMQV
jgi:hypothetical protein